MRNGLQNSNQFNLQTGGAIKSQNVSGIATPTRQGEIGTKQNLRGLSRLLKSKQSGSSDGGSSSLTYLGQGIDFGKQLADSSVYSSKSPTSLIQNKMKLNRRGS